jgi:RsiW-degrading membrane proteinase PrsW (M82 family)
MTTPPVRIRRLLVVAAVLSVASVTAYASDTPSALWLALIPLAYTVPIFMWLDHLEPEPPAMRWNAFLWGAGVSVLVASAVNEFFMAGFGLIAAAVVSAPIIEEVMKVRGISTAAKRGQLDSPLDGAVYAGYVGLGFAAVENVIYFSNAVSEDALGITFVVRGLLSPLAHPYFCVWAGLMVGRAVVEGRSRTLAVLRGLAVAIPLHASWNLAASVPLLSILLLGHVVLFFVLMRRLRRMRHEEMALVRGHLNQLAFTYNLSPLELEVYGDARATRRLRRQLGRNERRAFDERRALVTRYTLRLGG